ncbi:MAG: hypothetical protein LBU19_08170 [Treponema sp.]|jgi:mannose/fructose-specific phosphotransferase system component IIA|nr:hypothetical protein [Treponema sp.]
MRKILIGTHGKLALGYKDSIEMIAGSYANVEYICFYSEDKNYEAEVRNFMKALPPEDEIIVLTDMLAGSVCQLFLPYTERPGFYMFTGINLPIVLEIIMYKGEFNREAVDSFVRAGASELYYVDPAKMKEEAAGDFFE